MDTVKNEALAIDYFCNIKNMKFIYDDKRYLVHLKNLTKNSNDSNTLGSLEEAKLTKFVKFLISYLGNYLKNFEETIQNHESLKTNEKIDFFNDIIYSTLNYTHSSRKFCEQFHKQNGLTIIFLCLKVFFPKVLETKCKSYFSDQGEKLAAILFNLSKSKDLFKKQWKKLNCLNYLCELANSIENIVPFNDIYLVIFGTIAFIIEDKDFKLVHDIKRGISRFSDLIGECAKFLALKKPTRKEYKSLNDSTRVFKVHYLKNGWNLIELLECMHRFSIVDKLKYEIYNDFSLKSYLKQIIYDGNTFEKEFALKVLFELCSDDRVAEDVYKDFKLKQTIFALGKIVTQKHLVESCSDIMVIFNEKYERDKILKQSTQTDLIKLDSPSDEFKNEKILRLKEVESVSNRSTHLSNTDSQRSSTSSIYRMTALFTNCFTNRSLSEENINENTSNIPSDPIIKNINQTKEDFNKNDNNNNVNNKNTSITNFSPTTSSYNNDNVNSKYSSISSKTRQQNLTFKKFRDTFKRRIDDKFKNTEQNNFDLPSAQRLAKRIYDLDGFRPSDIMKHLAKKNEFSEMVANEYLKLFDFENLTLDNALRKFIKKFQLVGETQEKDRVLMYFSKRYSSVNNSKFMDADSCHTLTCALMLLNTDLHDLQCEHKMSLKNFIENLKGLCNGSNFPDALLESLYNSIKNERLECANVENANVVELNELKSELKIQIKEYKCGWLLLKPLRDSNGNKEIYLKRRWKKNYVSLQNMVIYKSRKFFTDLKFDNITKTIPIHHAFASVETENNEKMLIFRLRTADWSEYLFKVSNQNELLDWVNTINLVAAMFSSPPLKGGVGSSKRFQRPLLPISETRNNLQEQLESHKKNIQTFQNEIKKFETYITEISFDPVPLSKEETLYNKDKLTYLQFEHQRYSIYASLIENKILICSIKT